MALICRDYEYFLNPERISDEKTTRVALTRQSDAEFVAVERGFDVRNASDPAFENADVGGA